MSALDVITIRDLARGDGVTNDAPAFNTAISAAQAAGGGTISADVGTYNLSTNVTIPSTVTLVIQSGASFSGAGVVKTSGSGAIIDMRGASAIAFNVGAYGGSPTATGSANSTALASAVTAAAINGGTVYIPGGSWTFASTQTWANGVTIAGAGINATNITFTGSGYWIDYPTAQSTDGGGFRDMTINVSSAGTGAIRMGAFATRFSVTPELQDWRNLMLIGPGQSVAGTLGVAMYAVAMSTFFNITIKNFETGLLMEATTVNVAVRTRIWGCKFAFHYANVGATNESSFDQFFLFDLLGSFGTDGTGYAIKCEGTLLHVYEPFIEPSSSDSMKTCIWLTKGPGGSTNPAQNCRFVGGQMAISGSPSASVTNPILIDDSGAVANIFDGLALGGTGTIGASSVVAPSLVLGTNGYNLAVNCNQTLTDSLVATGNMQVFGQTRIQPPGGAPLVFGQQMQTPQLLLPSTPVGRSALIALGAGGFGAAGTNFQGSTAGTLVGGNLPSGSNVDFENMQVAGVSRWLVNISGQAQSWLQMYPGAEGQGIQTSGGILHSTGIPANGNGNNNDWCISDNGHLYFKSAGAWVQKV